MRNNFVQHLPNWLTYLRLALIPIFVFLLSNDPSRSAVHTATAVFIFAAITDYVDGWIARRFGAVSDKGKLLDPLADKILVMAALVMLVGQRSALHGEPWIPPWMVVVVLAREIWVTGLRGLAASNGVILSASSLGKVKSGLQMFSIVLLLLHDTTISLFGLHTTCQAVGVRLLLISLVFSIWGAVEYTNEVFFAAAKQGVVRPRRRGLAHEGERALDPLDDDEEP